MSRASWLSGLAIAGALGMAPAAGQTPPSPAPTAAEGAAIVRLHSLPISFEQGRIAGPGADLLMREGAATQFFLLAEYVSHVDQAVPLFMAALFEALHRAHGFNYVAVEQDPFGMEMLSTPPVRGNLDRVAERARLYPYSITFVNDAELRMLAEVGRVSTGGWRPIWGFDQAFGAKLPLEELLTLAPSAEAAAAVRDMLSEARAAEVTVPDRGDWSGTRNFETGHYMTKNAQRHVEQVERIQSLFQARPGTREEQLLKALHASALIYSYYQRSRERSPTGEPLGYFNNSVREQLMKDSFLDNYRLAQAADGRLPRVVIKAGSNHIIRGRNYTNIFSIGNMLHEFAITNRMKALTIAMLPIRQEDWPSFDKVPPELKPLLPSRDLSSGTLVDMRPLRAHLTHGRQTFGLEGKDLETLRTLIHGMDFALFLPSPKATYELTRPRAVARDRSNRRERARQ